jgi:hypothetical protein
MMDAHAVIIGNAGNDMNPAGNGRAVAAATRS